MQARRRPKTSSESEELNSLTVVIDNNENHKNQELNHLIPQNNVIDEDDNKYTKGDWNWRSFSNRIQISSGNAIRSWIPQSNSIIPNFYHNQPSAAGELNSFSNNNSEQLNTTYSNNINNNNSNNHNNNRFANSDEEEIFDKNSVIVMTSRDRSAEFANAIRSLQSRNISRAVNIKDPRKAQQIQSYSEFMMVAKYIGKNIASTYAKLEKLTMLAKKKSLFDDRPVEIKELTYIIKGDLNALNQQIAKLQDISKEQRRSTNGKHLLSHSSNMVLALQSKLATMSTDFKQVLEVRTENLKHQKHRRDQFSQNYIAGGPQHVGQSVKSKHGGSLLLAEENQISIDMSNEEKGPLISPAQQRQMMIYDDSDTYVQQRAETMQNIESTIIELGGIFQQLAHMVKEQEETVERIDTNVMDAEMNIEAAHSEILKYFQSVSKNRWLMIKVFGVLIFFFILFVFFMG